MTDPITIARAQAAIENGLIEALQSQAQADMDGTTVIVSRQACDEAAEFLPALYDEVKRLRAVLESIAKNTCCEGCQEAALVAREALKGVSHA